MTIDSNGKILVSGWSNNGTDFDWILARYNSDGTLDTSFGTDGFVTTDFFGDNDGSHAIAYDSYGKILVAGEAYNGTDFDFALAR
jgi:uncharacterized delta-60 repeat protein